MSLQDNMQIKFILALTALMATTATAQTVSIVSYGTDASCAAASKQSTANYTAGTGMCVLKKKWECDGNTFKMLSCSDDACSSCDSSTNYVTNGTCLSRDNGAEYYIATGCTSSAEMVRKVGMWGLMGVAVVVGILSM